MIWNKMRGDLKSKTKLAWGGNSKDEKLGCSKSNNQIERG